MLIKSTSRLLADSRERRSERRAIVRSDGCNKGHITSSAGTRSRCRNGNSPVCSSYASSIARSNTCTSSAFIQLNTVVSSKADDIRCRGISGIVSTVFTVVEVCRLTIVRSRVTNHGPTTDKVLFSKVCLLQLHVDCDDDFFSTRYKQKRIDVFVSLSKNAKNCLSYILMTKFPNTRIPLGSCKRFLPERSFFYSLLSPE